MIFIDIPSHPAACAANRADDQILILPDRRLVENKFVLGQNGIKHLWDQCEEVYFSAVTVEIDKKATPTEVDEALAEAVGDELMAPGVMYRCVKLQPLYQPAC